MCRTFDRGWFPISERFLQVQKTSLFSIYTWTMSLVTLCRQLSRTNSKFYYCGGKTIGPRRGVDKRLGDLLLSTPRRGGDFLICDTSLNSSRTFRSSLSNRIKDGGEGWGVGRRKSFLQVLDYSCVHDLLIFTHHITQVRSSFRSSFESVWEPIAAFHPLCWPFIQNCFCLLVVFGGYAH